MCTHFVEIQLLDVGTKIYPTLSVSQPLSQREKKKIPPYSFLKPRKKQAQSLDYHLYHSRKGNEKRKDRECVGKGGLWAIHPN